MTDAITQALRERLRGERETQGDYVARVQAFVHDHVHWFDRRPITKREWDEAVGDTPTSILRVRR